MLAFWTSNLALDHAVVPLARRGTRAIYLCFTADERQALAFSGSAPNNDLHDLIERDAILAAVIELGGAGRRMRRHLPRLLERATVLEVGRNASAAEGVVADLRCDAGLLGATAHHSPSIVSVEPLTIELRLSMTIRAMFYGLEEGDPSGVREFCTLKVFGQLDLQRV